MSEEKSLKTILICLIVFFLISCSVTKTVYDDNTVTDKTSAELPVQEIPAAEIPPPPVMVVYEGDILNIFFHGLIAWPEIAFRGSMKDFFLEWYVTADEYRKILNELYLNNYALIDIKELYEIVNRDGVKSVLYKKPLVPEGKKPMVLSVDDLSYYEHVKANGSVHKLVIDDKGGIAAWTDRGNGGELSYDLDVVTCLEEFIKKHPDFSVRGAKGILALTGYEGILGYFTHEPDSPRYQDEKKQAIAVVNKLKEMNWHFASHSWGHINFAVKPMSWLIYDQKLWDQQVKPILGETELFIYPFGAGVEHQPEKHNYLRGRNFSVFFGVGSGFGYSERKGYLYFDRRNIDGFYFRVFKDHPDRLFDFDKVVDKEMRNIK